MSKANQERNGTHFHPHTKGQSQRRASHCVDRAADELTKLWHSRAQEILLIEKASDPWQRSSPAASPVAYVHPSPATTPTTISSSASESEVATYAPYSAQSIVPRLPDRPRKPHYTTELAPFGKGFVLIVANFLEDLPGYAVDIQKITEFFRDTLGYEVFGGSDAPQAQLSMYRNLSRAQCIESLQEAQRHLNSRFQQVPYDRLFVFIMSHGDEHGIKTCRRMETGAIVPETSDAMGRPIRLRPEEVTRIFYHDHTETMKGHPKCFFIQTCMGNQILQAASDPFSTPGIPPVALGADTAVFYATSPGHQSYVHREKGSLFLQEIMEALNRSYMSEHLIDIMTDVRRNLSRKTDENADNQIDGAHLYQLPTTMDNLTARLYFNVLQ